jgi:hypothetical protein
MRNAGYWPECACGKQDPRIPRNSNGSPKDAELFILGLSFSTAVNVGDYRRAEYLLTQIEKRAQEILGELNRKS